MIFKMRKKQARIWSWLKYSGASISLTLNPCHWRFGVKFVRDQDLWAGPNERTWILSFLFITLRLWVDDGSW